MWTLTFGNFPIFERKKQVAAVGAPIGILAETEEEIAEAKARFASNGSTTTSSDPAPAPAEVAVAAAAPAAVVTAPPTSPPAPPPTAAPTPVVSAHPAAAGGRIVATPYAKKLAKQHKVGNSTANSQWFWHAKHI